MMLLQSPHPTQQQSPPLRPRKRKADAQPESNERLSKRLSLLNLEQNGAKIYVPVENAQRQSMTAPYSSTTPYAFTSSAPNQYLPPQPPSSRSQQAPQDDEWMALDDTKHKVYIYNIDDELSSESETESDRDKVIFLPDIEKHLRANRIPPHILSPPSVEDLADKQLVLYQVPSSISVPEEQDSVRKAIIEARARVRERQRAERQGGGRAINGFGGDGLMTVEGAIGDQPVVDDDPDAMELD